MKEALKQKGFSLKTYVVLMILSLSGSIIYGLPYFRKYYYDAYMQTYHLSNVEMGALGSYYGMLGLFSYLIGGVLADKLRAKYLLIFSLIATGAFGFLHLVFTDYNALRFIYGAWGITSLLTFWPALMKVVRTLGSDDEQSRAYGFFEGGRGIATALHLMVATAIFGFFQGELTQSIGLRYIIIFYSATPIVAGVLLIFLLENKEIDEEGLKFSDIFVVLKSKAVWLVVGITFCTYTFNMSYYYFTPFATNVIGTTAVYAATLTIIAQYIRVVAASAGGVMADKMGRAKIMLFGFFAMMLGVIALMMLENFQNEMAVYFLTGICVVIYFAMYSNFGIYYSLLSEGKVPLHLAGVAIGVVSTLGYLPEIFSPLIAGYLLDAYDAKTAYSMYFSGLVVVALVGMSLCFVWMRTFKKGANNG